VYTSIVMAEGGDDGGTHCKSKRTIERAGKVFSLVKVKVSIVTTISPNTLVGTVDGRSATSRAKSAANSGRNEYQSDCPFFAFVVVTKVGLVVVFVVVVFVVVVSVVVVVATVAVVVIAVKACTTHLYMITALSAGECKKNTRKSVSKGSNQSEACFFASLFELNSIQNVK